MTCLILAYHRVNDWSRDPLTVAPAVFRAQLALVRRHWTVVSLSRLADLLAGGAATPPRAAVITFDDGYHDNFLCARPILRELGLPATFFLAAACLETGRFLPREAEGARPPAGRDRPLRWGEAARLAAEGFEIGSHTLTHADLAAAAPARAAREIGASRELLRARLGVPVDFFCYPRGRFTPATARLVAAAGYRAALVTFPWRLGPRGDGPRGRPDLFALPRVGVYGHTGAAAFRLKTCPAFQWRSPGGAGKDTR